jgi:methyl-accepting chemotaxis protein
MVDELAEQSDSLTDEIDRITEATRRQRQGIDDVARTVDRLTDSMDET